MTPRESALSGGLGRARTCTASASTPATGGLHAGGHYGLRGRLPVSIAGCLSHTVTGRTRSLGFGGDAMQGLGELEEPVMGGLWQAHSPLAVRDVLSEINPPPSRP